MTLTTLYADFGSDENNILMAKSQEENELPEGFAPSEYDVICGWARQNYHHAGNRHLRRVVSDNVSRYVSARTKTEKGQIIVDIVNDLKSKSPTGIGFVKLNPKTGRWSFIGTEKVKDKIGHALRKASSAAEKKARKNAHTLRTSRSDDDDLAENASIEETHSSAMTSSFHIARNSHPEALREANSSSMNNSKPYPDTRKLTTGKKSSATENFHYSPSHQNKNIDGASFPQMADRDPASVQSTQSIYYGLGSPRNETMNRSPQHVEPARRSLMGAPGPSPPTTPVNRRIFGDGQQEVQSQVSDAIGVPGFLEPSPIRGELARAASASPSRRGAGEEPSLNPSHFTAPTPPYFYYPPPSSYYLRGITGMQPGQNPAILYPPLLPPPGPYPPPPYYHPSTAGGHPHHRLAPRTASHDQGNTALGESRYGRHGGPPGP